MPPVRFATLRAARFDPRHPPPAYPPPVIAASLASDPPHRSYPGASTRADDREADGTRTLSHALDLGGRARTFCGFLIALEPRAATCSGTRDMVAPLPRSTLHGRDRAF